MNEKRLRIEKQIADQIYNIMLMMDIPMSNETQETPARIAKMWCREVFENAIWNNHDKLQEKLKTFDSGCYRGNLLVCRDIPFNSMCEHHWMPFFGTATVGYVPNKRIIGLSKIPRIVHYYSKMPQLQERFTQNINDELWNATKPLAVFVEVKAKHTCVSCRGIELPSETVTFIPMYDKSLSFEVRDTLQNQFFKQKEA